MADCAVSITPRILNLNQNVSNNIIYWNPKGFSYTSIAKKMTGCLKTPKGPIIANFDISKWILGSKKCLEPKLFCKILSYIQPIFYEKTKFGMQKKMILAKKQPMSENSQTFAKSEWPTVQFILLLGYTNFNKNCSITFFIRIQKDFWIFLAGEKVQRV